MRVIVARNKIDLGTTNLTGASAYQMVLMIADVQQKDAAAMAYGGVK